MKGYRELESLNAEVKIYIDETIVLKETDVIEDIVSNINYIITKRDKVTGEEETEDKDYEIETCYSDKLTGYTYKEFLEECIKDIESSIFYDVSYTEDKDIEIIIEEITITIYALVARKKYAIEIGDYRLTKDNIMFVKSIDTEKEYEEFMKYYNNLDSTGKITVASRLDKALEKYLDYADDSMNY